MKGELKPSPARGDAARAGGGGYAGHRYHPHRTAQHWGAEKLKASAEAVQDQRWSSSPQPPSAPLAIPSSPRQVPKGLQTPGQSPLLTAGACSLPIRPSAESHRPEPARAGTSHRRVPSRRGQPQPSPAEGSVGGPPCPPAFAAGRLPAGGRQGGGLAALLPRALAALAPTAAALGGPGPPSRTWGCRPPARHRALL